MRLPQRHSSALGFIAACVLAAQGKVDARAYATPQGTQDLSSEAQLLRLDLRVQSELGPGRVRIDRGSNDGLQLGDIVFFHPLAGGTFPGSVIALQERTAQVELFDPALSVPPGTRAEIEIPSDRLHVEEKSEPQYPEHPPWENLDPDWTPDQPLLAEVNAVLPIERAMLFSGRFYAIGGRTWTSGGHRGDSFYRLGTEIHSDNPFGRGGGIQLDGELNWRTTDLPDERDEDDLRQRVDRLSYYVGGTRFAPDRHEGGRFLQHGMPEFGVLDGYEFTRRLSNGNRYGASIGFMPEPDPDYESFSDFQLAAFYEWFAQDSEERVSFSTGYQKTFHHGKSDRDLIVTKFSHVPVDGWNTHATTWLDYYTDRDDIKSSGFELTQAYLSTSRRNADGDGVHFTFNHLRFPELLRNEFLEPLAAELDNNHNERLGTHLWKFISGGKRVHVRGGLWVDEDDRGADAELGLEIPDLWADQSSTGFAVFDTNGQFSNTYGGRVTFLKYANNGYWDVTGEVSNNHQLGFEEDLNDLFQYRLRLARELRTAAGWNLSLFVESQAWRDDASLLCGFHIQRLF